MIVSSQNDKNAYQILSDVEELLHKQAAGHLTAKVFTVFAVAATFWDRI